MNKYNETIYELAEQELSNRRTKAEAVREQRKAELFAVSPEIRELTSKLEATSLEFLAIMTNKALSKDERSARLESLKEKNLKMQDELAVLLKAFKDDETYLDIPYTCKKCDDTGFCNGVRCECFDSLLKQFASKELTDNCGIELNDFTDFRLDLYPERDENGENIRDKMSKFLSYCKEYSSTFDKNKPSLLFIGMTGIGKTFMSSCIAKAVSENGYSVVFGSVSTFIRKLEDEHFGRSDGDTFDVLTRCDLLILDDLGSEFRTQFTESTLYDIINSRLNLKKPTIISTNLSVTELNSTYNERIVSRLTGCYVPMMFRGRDLRPKLRKY